MTNRSAIVIGAGIVGLATARALATRGYMVRVIERNERATGASIRNFGMIWPIGQPDGELYDRAMLSRRIWKEVCNDAGVWHDEAGSLHLAYRKEEWTVLQELADVYRDRKYELLNATDVQTVSPAVVGDKLIGGLYSAQELIVDPRQAIALISAWLMERFAVRFTWGRVVTDICYPAVYMGNEVAEADEIYVCSGADLETLFPQLFAEWPITKCKLQMMRLVAQRENWRIGPALCGGLSLAHYHSFKIASSLNELLQCYREELPEYLEWGIHVMVSQNESGELTIGDSHEYGLTHDPFDRQYINHLILSYLKRFARFPDDTIAQTWNGIYPKLTDGRSEIVHSPEQGVTIINGLGGAGMTLGFGLCEQIINNKSIAADCSH